MRRLHFGALLALLAATSLAVTVAARTRSAPRVSLDASGAALEDVPDSVRLAAMGLISGRQLVAIYFSGSRCRLCSTPEMKAAVGRLRTRLREANSAAFAVTSVVGVAINSDLEEGLDYLRGLDLGSFDEISVGKGWLNELAATYLWSDSLLAVGVPRVVLVSRTVDARLDPFDIEVGRDSIVGVVTGAPSFLKWVEDGPSVRNASNPSTKGGAPYP